MGLHDNLKVLSPDLSIAQRLQYCAISVRAVPKIINKTDIYYTYNHTHLTLLNHSIFHFSHLSSLSHNKGNFVTAPKPHEYTKCCTHGTNR